jgi:hypothetical protein
VSEQQQHHLGIALKSNGDEPGSGGYSFGQMFEIWEAANATKSDVMMMWWYPETSFQKYLRTDSEFSKVNLPPTTQQCIEAMVTEEDRCSEDQAIRIGESEGACDYPAIPLQKAASAGLYQAVYDRSISDGERSPAYEITKVFGVSQEQIGEMFDYVERARHARDGICDWVVDNLEFVRNLVPRTYPRVLQIQDGQNGLRYTAITVGCVAAISVLLSSVTVFLKRKTKVMVFSQVDFLSLVLFGLFAVSIGALVMTTTPSDASCVAIIWLINLGYTLMLVPLIVKVAAIHRLLTSGTSMRRTKIERHVLHRTVFIISFLVAVALIIWTCVDPPKRNEEYMLTDTVTKEGATVVTVNFYCSTESDAWKIAGLVWESLLLITASVLAFQTRNLVKEFNESRSLATMIYSHFVFVVARIFIFFLLPGVVSEHTLTMCLSLIFSVDTMAAIFIYFVPKFMKSSVDPGSSLPTSSKAFGSGSLSASLHRQVSQSGRSSSRLGHGSRRDTADTQESASSAKAAASEDTKELEQQDQDPSEDQGSS